MTLSEPDALISYFPQTYGLKIFLANRFDFFEM